MRSVHFAAAPFYRGGLIDDGKGNKRAAPQIQCGKNEYDNSSRLYD